MRATTDGRDPEGDRHPQAARDPDDERYPGERRGLYLFLTELRPAATRYCGERSMLAFAIRRALSGNDLARLRHARDLFNCLPKTLRRELSSTLVRAPQGPV